jgi:hypothetical protein
MEKRWCTACGQLFCPCPQVSRQSYCAEPSCQRERRRLWQQAKRRSDPDYLDNQVQAQAAWSQRNSDYWRAYRASHPEYVARNRSQQTKRNELRRVSGGAKMDASPPELLLSSGLYRSVQLEATVLQRWACGPYELRC